MTMTPQFQKVFDQINSPNIQYVLLQNYYNNVDAAQVALFVEKFMKEAIEEQNKILKRLEEDIAVLKEQQQQILELLSTRTS